MSDMFTETRSDYSDLRISRRFCDPSADITFQSSDSEVFRIHRRNLEFACGAFPPADHLTLDEHVLLTEKGSILELLFEFVYPRRHPLLLNYDFSTISMLAEAVEKYEVYPAMGICFIRMQEQVTEHPIEVLNYAARHDHFTLVEEAAFLTVGLPMDRIVTSMSEGIIKPWLIYNQRWIDLEKVHCLGHHWVEHPEFCPSFIAVLKQVNAPSCIIDKVAAALRDDAKESYPCDLLKCAFTSKDYRQRLEFRIKQIPKFSDIMNRGTAA